MRLFKLSAPVLALILSVIAVGLYFGVTKLFGIIGYLHFTSLQDLWYRFSMWFYMPAAVISERAADAYCIPHNLGMMLMTLIMVFQWWLIFSAAIWIFRCFRPRNTRAA